MEQKAKRRHWFATLWLIFIMIVNAIVGCISFFIDMESLGSPAVAIPSEASIALGILSLFNVVCAAMLLKWIKCGFWGVVATSIIAAGINLYIGLSIGSALMGFVGVMILYGVLQIKKEGISTWQGLS